MERLQQIEEIFQKALQHDPAERDSYVRGACRGDAELQREVASLLANHRTGIGSDPWAAAAAAQLIHAATSLQPGQSLGPYRIESFLAAGGMGEVYRATDTRLQREVAIKISAARFSERFGREARVIASLNHPNICQLYDVGPNYLVMELVEGPTLAERIRDGALPLDEALTIARQMADALEAAHERGVVHRDLKPGNVKVKPDGTVKVLDFGLAKARDEAVAPSNTSDSPTQTISVTRAGVILGTAAYMAPEQARGKAVDKRADIWAFGCVLFEMVTGKQAFQGETTSDILAALLKEEPDWNRIPPRVQPLLRRCLVKDPKKRLRDIGDAMPLLEGVPELVSRPARPWAWIAIATALVTALSIAVAGWWRATRPPPLHSLVQLSAELSPGATIDSFRRDGGNQLALSPDGTRIAVIEHYAAGNYRLATRRLDQSELTPLLDTEGANMPFFSPDSQWIAFFADGKLKKISVQGGSPVTLCDAPDPRGASWGDDDNILAAFNRGTTGLVRVPSAGGLLTAVTAPSKERFEMQLYPQVLPGSQAVLFTEWSAGPFDDAQIAIASLKTGQRKTVVRGGFFGRYLPIFDRVGCLVYRRGGTLFAAPFNPSRLSLTGAAQRVLEDLSFARFFGAGNFDFSGGSSGPGTFVYASSKGQFPAASVFWLNSAGKIQPLHSAPGSYMTPRFSPDGKRLAFLMGNQGNYDLWVRDLDRETNSRLTSLLRVSPWPVWTPDGKSIVFPASTPDDRNIVKRQGLYCVRADGAAEAQRLTDDNFPRILPYSFSPDGKRLAYSQQSADGYSEMWTALVEGDREHPRLGKAELFLRESALAGRPAFSPDGRWVAYESNETGTYEVYVRPFPGPGTKIPISTGGADFPIWSRNGRELFFLTPDRRIAVVDYTTKGDSFEAGKPRIWSEKRLLELPPFSFSFDLAPDGKRFVVVLFADGTVEPKPLTHLTVLENFFDELRRRVPAGGQ